MQQNTSERLVYKSQFIMFLQCTIHFYFVDVILVRDSNEGHSGGDCLVWKLDSHSVPIGEAC
jgi:hypothetical protein